MGRLSDFGFRSELRGRCVAVSRLHETAVPESEPEPEPELELELELCRRSAVSRNTHDLLATSTASCSFDASSDWGITVGYMMGKRCKWRTAAPNGKIAQFRAGEWSWIMSAYRMVSSYRKQLDAKCRGACDVIGKTQEFVQDVEADSENTTCGGLARVRTATAF
jgi:hypothetical protein